MGNFEAPAEFLIGPLSPKQFISDLGPRNLGPTKLKNSFTLNSKSRDEPQSKCPSRPQPISYNPTPTSISNYEITHSESVTVTEMKEMERYVLRLFKSIKLLMNETVLNNKICKNLNKKLKLSI